MEIKSKVAKVIWEFSEGEQIVLNAKYPKKIAKKIFANYLRETEAYEQEVINYALDNIYLSYIVHERYTPDKPISSEFNYFMSHKYKRNKKATKVWVVSLL